jgi:hypothetical protein
MLPVFGRKVIEDEQCVSRRALRANDFASGLRGALP